MTKTKKILIFTGLAILIIGLAIGAYFFFRASDDPVVEEEWRNDAGQETTGESGGSESGQQTDNDNTSTEDDVDVLNDYLTSGASNSEKYQAFADFVKSRPYAYDPTACSAEIDKSYFATAEGFKDVVDSTQPPAELLPFFDDLIAWLEKYDGLIQEHIESTGSTETDEYEQKLAVIVLQHQIITRGHSEALNDGSGGSLETANSYCKYDIPGLRI